jgi:hypothetical protein
MAQVYGQVESLTRVLRGLAQVGHKGLSRLDQVLQLRTEVEEAYGLLEDQQYALLERESIALEEEVHQLQIVYEQALADRIKKQEAEITELDEQLIRLRTRGQENLWLGLRTILFAGLINIYRNARQDRFARQRQSFKAREERPVRELKSRLSYLKTYPEKVVHERMLEADERLVQTKQLLDAMNSTLIGAVGEDRVYRELMRLPDTYFVLNDFFVEFDPPLYHQSTGSYIRQVQVDHLVISRAGVFLIETKNWSKDSFDRARSWTPEDQIQRAGYALFILLNGKGFFKWRFFDRRYWKPQKIRVRNVVALTRHKPHTANSLVQWKRVEELNSYLLQRPEEWTQKEVQRMAKYLLKFSGL